MTTPILNKPLARGTALLIVIVTLFIALFYGMTNTTLLYRGVFDGSWYIDASNFHAAILLQWVLAILICPMCLIWIVGMIRRSKNPQRITLLLLVIIAGFVALMLAHRWFETIICIQGSLPSECGL